MACSRLMAPSEIPDVFRQDRWYVLKSDFTILAVTCTKKKQADSTLTEPAHDA
jgi:hypothetical protein